MSFLKNMKIGAKLGLGFSFVLFLTAILGIVCIVQISKVNANTVDMATNWLPSVEAIGRLEVDTSAARRYTLNYLLTDDEKVRQTSLTQLQDMARKVEEDKKNYEPLISSDQERGLYNEFRADWDKYLSINNQTLDLVRANKLDAARTLSTIQGRDAMNAGLDNLAQVRNSTAKAATTLPKLPLPNTVLRATGPSGFSLPPL